MTGPYRTPDPPPPHKHQWKIDVAAADHDDGYRVSDPNHEFDVKFYIWCTECGAHDDTTLALLKFLPLAVFNSFLIKK